MDVQKFRPRTPVPPRAGISSITQPEIPRWRWDRLASLVAVVVGVGAIGSILCHYLLSLGIRRFVLIDPKRYRPESLASQCEEEEVGQFKVLAVARRLRRRGGSAAAWPSAVEHVEPGLAGANSLVIVCADGKSGQREANRLALEMRRPFYRINLEPNCLLASLTCLDFSRPEVPVCMECSWGQRDYLLSQVSAASCDAPGGRSTGSPRGLSALTAGWAAMTIVSTIASDTAGAKLSGREFLFSALGPSLSSSILTGNPDCLAPHLRSGSLVRLSEPPLETSFERLSALAGFGPGESPRVRGSGLIAHRCRCTGCGKQIDGIWWWRDPNRSAGRCGCGGRLYPLPFFSSSSWVRGEIAEAWASPLSSLGMGRKAAITFSGGKREVTFVLS